MRETTPGDEELVREALDGLFEIACEDHPRAVRESLQAQIEEMPAGECRSLVEEMVDVDELASRIREGSQDRRERPPSAPDERLQKVDEALEPLARWKLGAEGSQALAAMDDEERVHLLFSSLGP